MIQINSIAGDHLITVDENDKAGFSHKLLKLAVFENLDLSGHGFCDSDLQSARFINCNLTGCHFDDARCDYASFRGSSLTDSTFFFTKLNNANFDKATLTGAKLLNCGLLDTIGNGKELVNRRMGVYWVVLWGDRMQIGCKQYSIEQWWEFNDLAIDKMSINALAWWKAYKVEVKAMVQAFQETQLNQEIK